MSDTINASLKGSCLCGGVTYEASGEWVRFYLCHCSRCRKISGSAHGANIFTDKGTLTFFTGEDLISSFTVPGSGYTKSFCTKCSSPMPRVTSDAGAVMIPIGSLDVSLDMRPTAHIFTDSRANWDHDFDKVRECAARPT